MTVDEAIKQLSFVKRALAQQIIEVYLNTDYKIAM